ncbi:MAG: ABC transporter permease [Acidobacteria bacterium]|nr:ABC transporter permease [Acidobacteriota bacterium]
MSSSIRRFVERILSMFRKHKLDEDLGEEFATHIEMATEDNIKAGMNPDEARRQALIRFGGVEAARELHQDTRGLPLFENIGRDVRYGIRMLRKNPGFSTAAIITLALCIGANTAVFSMLDALAIKPLPFHESNRIVSIYTKPSNKPDKLGSSIPQYLDFKENVDAFSHLALWRAQEFNLGIGDKAIRSSGVAATAEIFEVLGLNPVLGRFFTQENNRIPEKRELVLTQSFWKSHFQEDPGVLGRTVRVDGEAYTVIGIAPKILESLNAQPRFIITKQWTPLEANNRYMYVSDLLGLLKPDATIGSVKVKMAALERRALDSAPPFIKEDMKRNPLTIGMETLQSSRVEPDLRSKLYLLQGVVLFVLLIGCVNVANLLLARSNARQGELAVRMALGSGRRAIARHLFVESFLLTWLGAALGIALALGIIEIVNVFTAQLLPKSLPFAIDGRMLAFTALIATFTSLTIGLFPVLHVFGSNLLALTLHQSRRVSNNRSIRTMSSGLIIAQMAITLALLIGGGLLIRSFINLLAVDPGFNPRQLVAAQIVLSADYSQDHRALKFQQQLKDNLREIPAFTSMSLASAMPYSESGGGYMGFKLQDYEQAKAGMQSNALFFSVDSSYLETMQMPLIEGRWFNAGDTGKSRPVCIVNQHFARQYVSGRSAVGKHVTFDVFEPEENWPEIVGIVGSVRDLSLEETFGRTLLPAIYRPAQQNPFPFFLMNVSVLIRSPRPAPEVIALLREKVKEIDPALPLFQTGSMESIISTSFDERRAIMLVLCCFAGIALLLSAVGIYGVLAYDVSKRTHEIGIRGAIGATRKQIIALILRQGLQKALIGLAIGLVGAFYLSNFMTSLLFEIKPTDPTTYVFVSTLLLCVAVLASYIPALRAAGIDPVSSLRVE